MAAGAAGAAETTVGADGGAGGLELATAVDDACRQPGRFRPLSPSDLPLREKIATITGRVVRFVDQSPEEGFRSLRKAGESEWSARAWVELLAWFQEGEGTTNGSAVAIGVEEVLDRAPRTFDAFLRENVKTFGG